MVFEKARVAIFTNSDKDELEKEVNDFLEDRKMINSEFETDVIPIQYDRITKLPSKAKIYYTIYITYVEKEH